MGVYNYFAHKDVGTSRLLRRLEDAALIQKICLPSNSRYREDARREVEFLIVLAVIALLMMGYLGYALARPERF